MRYSLLFLCFSGCITEELTESQRVEFQDVWWELNCSYEDCPLCFGLSTETNEVYTWYPGYGLFQQGSWTFEEPNLYTWEESGSLYGVRVVENGDCFDLHMGLRKEVACRCDLLPKNFIDPLDPSLLEDTY